jgi:hypothetical protein
MEAGVQRGGKVSGHCDLDPGTAEQKPVQAHCHRRPHEFTGQPLADGIAAAKDGQARKVGQRRLVEPMHDPRAEAGGHAIDRLTGGQMALDHSAALGHPFQRLGCEGNRAVFARDHRHTLRGEGRSSQSQRFLAHAQSPILSSSLAAPACRNFPDERAADRRIF